MHVYVGDLVDASRCYWWIQHRTPEKNVGEGTVKYDTFFSNCEKVPDVGCLISPFGFFGYTYLLFLWFICQQTRCYGRYKVDISMEYIYIYFYARYLHFIMRYLNIVTVFFSTPIRVHRGHHLAHISTLQGMVAMFTRWNSPRTARGSSLHLGNLTYHVVPPR